MARAATRQRSRAPVEEVERPVRRREVRDTVRAPIERAREVTRVRNQGRDNEVSTTSERRLRAVTREVPAIHAKVGVSGSGTVNMGNFNSVQARVWIELPCAPTPDAIEEAYEEASRYVERWVQRELDAATGAND